MATHSVRELSSLRFKPYDVLKNQIQKSSTQNVREISLDDFDKGTPTTGSCIVVDTHADTGDVIREFVPHIEHYSTARKRRELVNAISSWFGVVRKRTSEKNYLKTFLKSFKTSGGGVISPERADAAPIISYRDLVELLQQSNKSIAAQYPDGVCVTARTYYIPPQALISTRSKKCNIENAVRGDLNLPSYTRDRVLSLQHRYGSPKENIARGKFSMIRQVNTKKRLVTSGRAVISILPRYNGRANLNVVALPKNMHASFYGAAQRGDTFAIIMCYPINTLAHTPSYRTVPWDNDTIGVPSNFLPPQSRDFDGDTAIVVPILDYESIIHAQLLSMPSVTIFSGVDFVIKPTPHIILGSGKSKTELFTEMFNCYALAQITNSLHKFEEWYCRLETDIGDGLAKLPPVDLDSYLFNAPNETLELLKSSKATRYDTSQILSLGQIDDDAVIAEGLGVGIKYGDLFKMYTAGRRAVVDSKCDIGDEGKKQNIIQFAIPDIVVEWTYELSCQGKIISSCFIDQLPVAYRLPDTAVDVILAEFDKYLA